VLYLLKSTFDFMELSIFVQCLLALLLGAVIGFERESYEHEVDRTATVGRGSLGVRTYALVALLGAISTIVTPIHFGLFLLIAVTFVGFLVSYYIFGSITNKDHGLTTELAILFAFLIGAMIGIPNIPIQLTIALTVILAFIMSTKKQVKTFIKSIKEHEVDGFIAYAIIALVILPFLPKEALTLGQIPYVSSILDAYGIELPTKFQNLQIINPHSLWRVVAIITGVEILGYFLQKAIGQKKGWLLTSIAGGFVSSTATTQSLALQSKRLADSSGLVGAAIVANVSSFFQLFVLIASINPSLLVEITPFALLLILSGIASIIFFTHKSTKEANKDIIKTKRALEENKLFALRPALKFALIFVLIKFMAGVMLVLVGDTGYIVANILGAVTGLDAVIFGVSEIAGSSISMSLAVVTLASANTVNLVTKAIFSYTHGSRDFATKISKAFVFIILSSFIGLIPLLF
jgi:uncharacterized membrane protein (DUF4010 family)